ncbi:tRNA (Uracil-5-)-methyltransferase family protein [Anoxybacillus sp. B7M1]|uniref:Class I SAM-dependent methyltransferase n=1 Tax=Anoxybacteroides rupiense TaxID=311460 RepID=A0ABT5W742_9BACL|nr:MULTISPECIES: class I SAM-dependent methyltransferase [Anoxybacillus]ANB55571.1 tRNA (Uracil-5-)-methyltransferase family protein [Anoxybacillus sp. B2M1]ANB65400.1 tRNA (Uracil-5-)-methyltransferase family protein [Anoxybacillus sp. B7M1]KXG08723.1 Ribosomal RNA small subunit methyltransferase C [Anoxybacillus sp. P3H1B]MDE8565138.1 class I SAM-dependent methyltransferase [Anoxybacillus rupiensis]QHC02672.1 methyltransferase [Anoxybacillus sp. PDR2]
MSEHYYSKAPSSSSDPHTWSYTLRGNDLLFTTDQGVFSKREVDFGSRLLIETFEEPLIQGDFLDVGCGYGPIGLALAKSFPERKVEMVDINERAIALARQNQQQNQIHNAIIYESNLFQEIGMKKFAAILTNPPIRAGKQIVHSIFAESVDHLLSGGELWIVIQKKQGAPSALEKLQSLFPEVEVITKKKGYYIIKAKKY